MMTHTGVCAPARRMIGALRCALLCAALGAAGAAAAGAAELRAKVLFEARCGICHSAGGTGALMLARREGRSTPLLTQRTDLTADFVRVAVRAGSLNMPRMTRVEVTDEELGSIAGYLVAPKSALKAEP
jgi:mono/diheme cytochrome c family protein